VFLAARRSVPDDAARDLRRDRARRPGGAAMMPVRHVFAKDLRRLRWPLAGWLAVVVVRVVAAAAVSESAFAPAAVEAAIQNVSALLTIADILMLVLLVSWLVHDEPLTSADAFWLTRPIRPTMLMLAKL